MRVAQAFILVYLAVQIGVGFRQIESWPFTHGPMFSKAPRSAKQYQYEGVRNDGSVFPLAARDLGRMRRPQLRRWIRELVVQSRTRDHRRFCAGLFAAYRARSSNAEAPVKLRVYRKLLEPGEGSGVETVSKELLVECSSSEIRRSVPAPRLVASAGMATFEAEWFSDSLPGSGRADESYWVLSNATGGYSGSGFVEAAPNRGTGMGDRTIGPRLDYQIDFHETGEYFVWVRMLGASPEDDSVHVGLNGNPVSFGRAGVRDSSGVWTWTGESRGRVPDSRISVVIDAPGTHTFHLWMREDGALVDKFVLVADRAFTPPAS